MKLSAVPRTRLALALDARARAEDRRVSAVIRRAVVNYLEDVRGDSPKWQRRCEIEGETAVSAGLN
jgi:hypothetical protein